MTCRLSLVLKKFMFYLYFMVSGVVVITICVRNFSIFFSTVDLHNTVTSVFSVKYQDEYMEFPEFHQTESFIICKF